MKHSYKIKLIKPYTKCPFWALKIYPNGSGRNGLTLAKRKSSRVPSWILRLYREISQFNSDIPLTEVKKYVGQFMSKGCGKNKKSRDQLIKMNPPKRSKRVGVL